MNDSEREIKKLYRGVLRREMSRLEIQEEKEHFLSAYFREARPAFFFPQSILSAAGVLGLFLLVVMLYKPLHPVRETGEMRQPGAIQLQASDVESPIPVEAGPVVHVKRVTSHVGSTMVYQKTHKDVPITVIWVFSGGK